MSFFRELDLYKAIILVSLLLLPVALGFVWWVDGELKAANVSIDAAERRGGEIEKIGTLQRKLETVEQNAAAVRSSGGSPAVFFQNQITTSSRGTVGTSEYEISPPKRGGVPGRSNAQDMIVSIMFRKDLDLPRDLVHALVFNCESTGAQIWKLRRLSMKNTELAKLIRSRNQSPPKTVKDDWTILALDFARREPDSR